MGVGGGGEERAGTGGEPGWRARCEDRAPAGIRSPGSWGGESGPRERADPADIAPGVTPSLQNLRDNFAWGADSSRAGRRRYVGPRTRFQPQLAEWSVVRAQDKKHAPRFCCLHHPLSDLGLP